MMKETLNMEKTTKKLKALARPCYNRFTGLDSKSGSKPSFKVRL
ncbi:hypothetical protein BSG1_20760 [Bacillus sp. SG-1]|nr:hypothetical protein BSG1_20760 [Bacillus sp. SG-1]